jgi:hypothetical protein
MHLIGLHILLSYQCTFECDHCFVWGSPRQSGTFTIHQLEDVFAQAKETRTINEIYFEGGEPFLYYPTLLWGVHRAHALGFKVGVVSNAYWATSREDALVALRPLAGLLTDLTVSSDLFHYSEQISEQARHAEWAAQELAIPTGMIQIASVEAQCSERSTGMLPEGQSGIMYRGRASEELANKVEFKSRENFVTCPYEDLREPGRMHLDPLGNLHICQGIVIGNLFEKQLAEICQEYDPQTHPVVGPLLRGGPLALAETYNLVTEYAYADACNMCYQVRKELRPRFPSELAPDQMYGVIK